MPQPIDTRELKQWLDANRPCVLLDVLPKEAFEELRLPGARNACVYEMTFLDQAAEAVPDRNAAVVVYGSGPSSLDAADAAQRLEGAGYGDVRTFEGGREAWQEAGHAFEGPAERWVPSPPSRLPDGDFAVDTEKSLVEWVGRNVGNRHHGTLRLSSGEVSVADGRLAAGRFVLDMRSIEVGDLEGDMAALLKRHLEHEDFFAAERFPEATLEIRRAAPIEGATPGTANYDIEGVATIRDRTGPLAFPASVGAHGDGVALQAHFDLDRTRWGAHYGSGKLYHRLGMHLVNDAVSLQVRVITAPA